MKIYLSFIYFILFSFSLLAQKKGLKKPLPSSSAALFKTQTDSLSYSLGMSLASFYKQQGITNINASLVNKAINDVMKTGKPLLTEEQMNLCITNYLQKKRGEKTEAERKSNAGIIEANHRAGESFLSANRVKPEVTTTASGLQYQILKQGEGPKPLATDKVRCHYRGTLIDGTVFESSIERGQPAEFQVNGVIPGWVEALQLMPVGSRWRLFLPSNLAYGDNAAGPKISAGSTLIFEVELLEIIK